MSIKGFEVGGVQAKYDYESLDNIPANLVQDANYVHTDNNYTNADKTKLSGIEAQANKTTIDATLTHSGQAADAKATGDEINDLKSAFDSSIKQINGETISGSRDSSGSVYIEYYFVDGQKYLLTNTSQSGAIVAATQNVKGTDVQRITSGMAANGTKEFTATEDAKYLWVYGDEAFSFSVVNLSSAGTRLNDVSNKVDNLSGEVKQELEISATASGYKYLDYSFEVGKKYLFENLYEGSVVANTVSEKSSSAIAINSITRGATGKAMLCFEPTADAPIIRIYFTDANGKAKISEIGTLNYTVESLKSITEKVSNYRCVSVKNGSNSIYYPVEVGKTYKVSNITTVPASGTASDYSLQIFTRSTPTGENIDTVSSGLYPGRSVYFKPTNNAEYLRMQTPAVGEITITVDEMGTLTEYFGDIDTKKPYQSGQIHFTVPVNQKRLYFTQGSENVAQDSETDIVNVNCVLMLPPTYTPIGDKTNLLMIVHGSGGGVTESTWFRDDATVLAFFQKFIDAGFAIFDCNGYKNGSEGQESWGVDTASIAYHKAYEYVVKNYNVTEEMCVYGFSMGGLNALNYCNMFPGGIKALGLGSPVVSLYNTIWVDASVQAKGDVSRAYGFAVSGTYEADTVGNCDAFTRIKTIDDVDYYLQRLPTVKIWHGDSDTAVYYQYSQRLYNAIKNSGGFAYYRIVTGKGHEICYGGNANVANEIVMYFKRFVLT